MNQKFYLKSFFIKNIYEAKKHFLFKKKFNNIKVVWLNLIKK